MFSSDYDVNDGATVAIDVGDGTSKGFVVKFIKRIKRVFYLILGGLFVIS